MSSSVGPCEAPAMTVADLNTPRLHLTGQNLKLAEMIQKIAIFEAEHAAYFLGSPQCAKTRHVIAASTPATNSTQTITKNELKKQLKPAAAIHPR